MKFGARIVKQNCTEADLKIGLEPYTQCLKSEPKGGWSHNGQLSRGGSVGAHYRSHEGQRNLVFPWRQALTVRSECNIVAAQPAQRNDFSRGALRALRRE